MKIDGLDNLALGKTARQSSVPESNEKHKFSRNDASKALADDGKRDLAFHTDSEENPWWQVDLEAVYPLYYIVIGNRRKRCQERAITLTLETSLDGQIWQIIHTGLVSWDNDLVWPLGGFVSARFVRLSLREKTCLHLAKIEVWGTRKGGLKPKIVDSGLLWTETKPKGLRELKAALTVPASPTEMILDLGDFHPLWALELTAPPKTGFKDFKDLKIEYSIDGRDWRIIHEGLLFWTSRLYYPLQGEIMARFIKISHQKISGVRDGLRSLIHRLFNLPHWPQIKIFSRMQKDLQVIMHRTDGLGCRILPLLNAIYIAKVLNCDFKICWSPCSVDFNDSGTERLYVDSAENMFSSTFLQKHYLESVPHEIDQNIEFPLGLPKFNGKKNLSYRHLMNPANHNLPQLILSPNIRPEELFQARLYPSMSTYKALFDALPFNPELKEIIDAVQKIELPNNYIAVHIRTGDALYAVFRESLLYGTRACTVQVIKMLLDTLKMENKNIILFSDDHELSNYLAGIYEISRAADYLSMMSGITSPQRDFAEIILMSRASRIYCPLDSKFSGVASLIGGNIERIALNEIASDAEKAAYIEADLEKNEKCYNQFHNMYSYLYLYDQARQVAGERKCVLYLERALKYDPENTILKLLRAVEHYKDDQDQTGEDILMKLFDIIFDLTQTCFNYKVPFKTFKRNVRVMLTKYYRAGHFEALKKAASRKNPYAAAVMYIIYKIISKPQWIAENPSEFDPRNWEALALANYRHTAGTQA